MDAHGYGKRFIVRSEEKLTTFVELERTIYQFAVALVSYSPRRNAPCGWKTDASLESAARVGNF